MKNNVMTQPSPFRSQKFMFKVVSSSLVYLKYKNRKTKTKLKCIFILSKFKITWYENEKYKITRLCLIVTT